MRPLRIISSPYRRCLQTVTPLAERLALPLERSRALVPHAPDEALVLVRALSDEYSRARVVVCTHGETMGALLTELAEDAGIRLERRPPGLKGCLWILNMRLGTLVDARYVVP